MSRAALPPIGHERIHDVIDRVLGSFVADGRLRYDEAEDVRAGVMLRVLQQADDGPVDAVRSPDDYVARMTINAANDVLRSRRFAHAPLTDAADDTIDESPEPQEALATRQLLTRLWDEIRELPLMQRRALLLHARDHNGSSAVTLLVFTGVATLDEIAGALSYPRRDLEELWDRLPLADLDIGDLLFLTRPQVISLRRTARERLERARRRLALPRFKR